MPTTRCPAPPRPQRRKRQLKAREAGKVEAGHVSAGGAVLGMIAGKGAAAGESKVGAGGACCLLPAGCCVSRSWAVPSLSCG